MKATLLADVEAFPVPLGVTAFVDDFDPVKVPLPMVDSLTLDRLCSDFRTSVFATARKEPPPELSPAKPKWPKDAFELLKNDIWCKKGFASPRHFEEGQVEDLSAAIEQLEAYFKAL